MRRAFFLRQTAGEVLTYLLYAQLLVLALCALLRIWSTFDKIILFTKTHNKSTAICRARFLSDCLFSFYLFSFVFGAVDKLFFLCTCDEVDAKRYGKRKQFRCRSGEPKPRHLPQMRE